MTNHASRKFLDHLDDSVGMFGMRFSHSDCKMLLQEWISSKSNLVLTGRQFGQLDRISNFSSSILTGNYISRGVRADTEGPTDTRGVDATSGY